MKCFGVGGVTICGVILVSIWAHTVSGAETRTPPTGAMHLLLQDQWKMVWSDEFDGNHIDTSKWEIQGVNDYYASTPRQKGEGKPDGWWTGENAFLSGHGTLVIQASVIPDKNGDNDPQYAYDYATAALRSRGLFEQRYGKFEIYCKLPAKQGWWVAFWLQTDSTSNVDGSGEDGSEIDIMEGFGWNDRINHAVWWDGYGSAQQGQNVFEDATGIREGYHKYTLIWSPEEYLFLIDDVLRWRTDAGGVSKVPEYIRVTGEISSSDSATSTSWANQPHREDFPDTFTVDWVRVYSLKKP